MRSHPTLVSKGPLHQQGVTLVISLIMLVLITLLTIAAFKIGKGNLQIVGNMQQRSQTMAAAQGAIEQVISQPLFATTPSDAIAKPCVVGILKVPNTTCVDFYGDGVAKVTVTVLPTCRRSPPVPNASLDLASASDAGCALSISQTFGIAGSTNNNSLCADALWDIQASANDPVSNAQSSINQGVNLRQAATTPCP